MADPSEQVDERDYPGVTPPASLDFPNPNEVAVSRDLEAYINHVGGFLSEDDVKARCDIHQCIWSCVLIPYHLSYVIIFKVGG